MLDMVTNATTKFWMGLLGVNSSVFLPVEMVPDYSKLTLTQAKRLEMDSQVIDKTFVVSALHWHSSE